MASRFSGSDNDSDIVSFFNDSTSDSEFEGFGIDDIPNEQFERPTFTIDQCENDRELPVDREYGWTCQDSPPHCAPFTGKPGLNVNLPDDSKEIDFFNLMFDENMWLTFVQKTNRYAESRIESLTLSAFSRLQKWSPVCVDEMNLFIGLVLAMGLTQKPDVTDYWSNDETHRTPFFGNNMTRDRLLDILSNFHLVDNTTNAGDDRLYKIRPFLNMLRFNFAKHEPE